MSGLRQNIVYGTQPTGHAQISAEGHFPFEISDEQLPESQPEGLGFSQSSEGLQNPLTTDLESRQSELSEYVSGNNQRPELAKRQRPQDRGQEMHIYICRQSLGTAVEGGWQPPGKHDMQVLQKENEGKGQGQPEIPPSNIQVTVGRGNAMAASNMGHAKRLTALGTAVEGGGNPQANIICRYYGRKTKGKVEDNQKYHLATSR